jgi:site-specific DNA-methyltransferase (adenine-specific)/modification methylase
MKTPESTTDVQGGCSVQRLVGRHCVATLYLGDSETMDRIEADALVSDPPYGISIMAGKKIGGVIRNNARWKQCRNTEYKSGVSGDDKQFDPARWLSYPTVILWGANHYASRLPDSPCWLVWHKRIPGQQNNFADVEMAWTNLDAPARYKQHLWMGMVRDSEMREHHHPTQKPVVVMAWAMEQCKVPAGATVLDPYMGSGTTGIACLRMGMNFVGIEKDPEHFATACSRLEREANQGVLL